MKTQSITPEQITRRWYLVDAEEETLGRLASRVAQILRGKHKPIYTPHLDTGDFVLVVNAEKVVLTGKKLDQKRYYRHSGYPGGLKETPVWRLLETHPERVIESAVRGMLPKGKLGRRMFRKLKVYAGPDHPHGAQQPVAIDLEAWPPQVHLTNVVHSADEGS
ncbi:MAG TPA: 50S ribosomal protein L13 [Gemmatimonadota bacterium]|nr:50S ribosomal protein L13 [Gemmatimonadota bacterium]